MRKSLARLATLLLLGGTQVLRHSFAAELKITSAPSIEMYDDRSAIIKWTTNTNGNSRVRYGTVPDRLSEIAESPNRMSPNASFMMHRVLMLNLKPSTTYYYTVESRGVTSAVSQFKTRDRR